MKKYIILLLLINCFYNSLANLNIETSKDWSFSAKDSVFVMGGGILMLPINIKLNTPKNKNIPDFKGPLLTTGAGVLLLSSSIKQAQKDWHSEVIKGSSLLIDDYLAFAPNSLAMGLGIIGVKAKHNFKERLLIATLANGISLGTTFGLKYITQMKRPDNSESDSFPSGHTSFAFTGAQIMHEEYGQNSIIYSIAGYGIGSAVGALRMINNRHWLADVVTGAGIGMVSTKLAYLLYPWAKKKVFKTDKLAAMPIYLPDGAGISLALNF